MRPYRRPALLAGLVLTLALVAGGGPATAQDVDCARAVWALPIESLDLPEGWSLSELSPSPTGGWQGSLEIQSVEGDTEDEVATTDRISFALACIPDSRVWMDVDARARALFPDRYRVIGAVEVGDLSTAFRDTERNGGSALRWANDMVVGTVSADHAVDWSTVEDVALELDAILP
jgi:hypothetical protein